MPFSALFRFMDGLDAAMISLGLLMACVAGASQPLLIVVFGDLTGAAANIATSQVQEIMRPLVLRMVWLSVGALASWGLAFWLVPLSADRQLHKMRKAFHSAVLRQDLAFFDSRRPGEMTVLLTEGCNDVRNALANKLVEVVQAVAQLALGIVIAFVYSWELSLVMIALMPLMGLAMKFAIEAGTVGDAALGKEEYKEAGSVATEAVASVRTVASLGGEPSIVERFSARLANAQRAAIRQGTKLALSTSLLFAVMFFQYGAGFWYGGFLIADSRERALRAHPAPFGLNDVRGDYLNHSFAPHAAVVGALCNDTETAYGMESCACDIPWGSLGDDAVYLDPAPDCGCGHGKHSALGGVISDGTGCKDVATIITAFFALLIGGFALGQVGPSFAAFSKGRLSAAVIFKVLDRAPAIDTRATGSKSLGPKGASGHIRFENVSFCYRSADAGAAADDDDDGAGAGGGADARGGEERMVFKDLSFEVKAGETVAFVGESGSGKSTIAKLVSRFYDVDSGAVSVDGVDVRELGVRELRNNMAVVSQEPLLFDTSVARNIAQGAIDPDAVTPEQVEAAAVASDAHRFISDASKFPQGYQTSAGARGSKLSGGQKQRVALARGLVRNAPILVLDEATSALDSRSERKVQRALEERPGKRTTIVIAHRLSTVRRADRIFVLGRADDNTHGSRIVESGTHDELMDAKGMYYALVGGQMADPDSSVTDLAAVDDADDAAAPAARPSRAVSLKAEDTEKEGNNEEDAKAMLEHEVPRSRVWGYARGNEALVLAGVVSSIGNGCVFPTIALFFAEMLTAFTIYDDGDLRREVVLWSICLFIVSVVGYFTNAGQVGFMTAVGERITTKVRVDLLKAMLRQDISFFDRPSNSVGALMSQLGGDAGLVQLTTGAALGAIVNSMTAMLYGIVIAFLANWKLAAVVLAAVPLLGAAQALQMQLITAGEKGVSEDFASSTGEFNEAVHGIREVHAFSLYPLAEQSYATLLKMPFKNAQRTAAAMGGTMGMSQLITFGFYALCFWYGGKLIDDGEMNFYEFMKGLFVLAFAGSGAGQAATFAGDQAKAKAAVSKAFWLMDRTPPIDSRPWGEDGAERPVDAKRATGLIELKGVGFVYPRRPDAVVFGGIDLRVEPGQTVALVGASGSGKSTVVQLLERFYDPVAPDSLGSPGVIALDGVDLRELDVKWLRSQVGLVSQEPRLFFGSVHDNIAMGRPGASRAEVVAAARAAAAHDFIEALPDGYDSQVGAGGGKLSGGQKQRVAIARAIIKDPKILLLDEATSALDNESEKLVQASLSELLADRAARRTTLVIAHRLSTVRSADRIVVLDTEGELSGAHVVEEGTHDELMAKGGMYARLSAAFDGAGAA